MNSTLRTQLECIDSDFNQSLGIPPHCYASNDFLPFENSAVLRKGWLPLGREDRWKTTGQYSAMDFAGIPIIVVRNKSGKLKAFANSCRHRNSTLLEGTGECKKIKCPFHWWTYSLDGELKVYPRMENAANFNPAENNLIEFHVETKYGFAFINFEESHESFDSYLGDFDQFHQEWDLDNLETTRVREFDVDCNWKTFIEVFNEYYHLPSVHPDSINWLYPEPDPVDTVTGSYTTQFGRTEANAALLADNQGSALPTIKTLTGRWKMGTRYTWLYPNLTYAISQDSMWCYQAFPLSANKSHIIQTIAFPRDTVALDDFEERAEHYYTRIDAAVAEDLPFLEQQQIGLNSPFAKPGRFGALEPSVGRFSYWYAQQLLQAESI